MKLTIDTVNKTIIVLERIKLEDLISYIKEHEMEDWSIEPEDYAHTYIPYVQPVSPYEPPYYVTCTTTN